MPRLDVLVTKSGLAESRERAQALILAGKVRVGGETVRSPARTVSEDAPIAVDSEPGYASRGALKLVPALLRAGPHAEVVALFKPQFEVGRTDVGKGGIVRDAAAIDRASTHFREWCETNGYRVVGEAPSEVAGAEGNREIFFHLAPVQ